MFPPLNLSRRLAKWLPPVLVALLTWCPAAWAKDLKIVWVHSNAAAQSEQRVKAGWEQWQKQNAPGWTVDFLDSQGSGEKTAANLQNAISRSADAVIMTMSDLRASRSIIQKAAKDGLPIFTVDSGWVPGDIVDVTTNNWDMSAKVSTFLLNSIGGKGNIIFLRMAEHHGTRKRGDVMAAILKEYPDVKVLAEHNLDYTKFYEDATRVMEDYANRFGDQINAVWAPWDEPAMAAANVLKAKGIKAIVTGIDGHPPAVQAIKSGSSPMVATVSQPFEEMGAKVGGWIKDIVVDKKNPDTMFTSRTVYLDAPLITKQSN